MKEKYPYGGDKQSRLEDMSKWRTAAEKATKHKEKQQRIHLYNEKLNTAKHKALESVKKKYGIVKEIGGHRGVDKGGKKIFNLHLSDKKLGL